MLLWIFPAVLSASSNGHRCLVLMIQELTSLGIPCGVLVPSPTRFKQLSTLHIPETVSIIRSDQIPASSLSVVATDTSDGNYVNQLRAQNHRIIWWLMAPPVVLGAPFPQIESIDEILLYSSFVLPGLSSYFFLQDPGSFEQMYDLNKEINIAGSNLSSSSGKKIGIYCGKGRLTPLPESIESYLSGADLIAFSRYWPKSRQEYNELILSLDALISYDPLTAVNLDVACQGKPVYLPNNPFDKSPIHNSP